MKNKFLKRLISLILCFSMLLPTAVLFAEEPSVHVENSESEKYEIVDGSTIGKSSGEKYLVKFVKTGQRYEYVQVKPTSGSYETIPGTTKKITQTVIVSNARREAYYETEKRTRDVWVTVVDSPARTETYYVDEDVRVITGYGKKEAGTDTITKYRYITERKVVKSSYWKSERVLVSKGYHKYVMSPDGGYVRKWFPAKYRTKKTYVPAVYTQTRRKEAYTETITRYVTDYSKPIYKTETKRVAKTREIPERSHSEKREETYTVQVKRYRNIPAVTKEVVSYETTPTTYKVRIPSRWEVQRSSAVNVGMTSVWAPNGSRSSAYIKDGKTYLMNHQRLPNGYISYAGGAYYLKISEDRGQKSTSFEPAVYERSRGKYHTSAQEKAAQVEDEKKKREKAEYDRYASQIRIALLKQLASLRATIQSKSHLSGLISEINQRENYIRTNKINPKTWKANGERTSSMILDGKAYLVDDSSMPDGYIYKLNNEYYEVRDGAYHVISIDEEVFERTKGKYKTQSAEDADKPKKDMWNSKGEKVEGYMFEDAYYLKNGSDVPDDYVIHTAEGYRYKTGGTLVEVSNFSLNTFISTKGEFFNGYQKKLNNLGYSITNKLDDKSAIKNFATDFNLSDRELTSSIQAKINEIHDLYPNGLGGHQVNDTTKEIQKYLNILGSKLIVDGMYGSGTKSAVKAFQNEKNRTEYADKETVKALKEAAAKVLGTETIEALLEEYKTNFAKRSELRSKIEAKVVHVVNNIMIHNKNSENSYLALKEIYTRFNTTDMRTYLPSIQSKINDEIKKKGPFYFREASGQCVSRVYPAGTGDWISEADYLKFIEVKDNPLAQVEKVIEKYTTNDYGQLTAEEQKVFEDYADENNDALFRKYCIGGRIDYARYLIEKKQPREFGEMLDLYFGASFDQGYMYNEKLKNNPLFVNYQDTMLFKNNDGLTYESMYDYFKYMSRDQFKLSAQKYIKKWRLRAETYSKAYYGPAVIDKSLPRNKKLVDAMSRLYVASKEFATYIGNKKEFKINDLSFFDINVMRSHNLFPGCYYNDLLSQVKVGDVGYGYFNGKINEGVFVEVDGKKRIKFTDSTVHGGQIFTKTQYDFEIADSSKKQVFYTKSQIDLVNYEFRLNEEMVATHEDKMAFIHNILDAIGLEPTIGSSADIINGLVYFGESISADTVYSETGAVMDIRKTGLNIQGTLSIAAALPGLDVLKPVAKGIGSVTGKVIGAIGQSVKKSKIAKEFAKHIDFGALSKVITPKRFNDIFERISSMKSYIDNGLNKFRNSELFSSFTSLWEGSRIGKLISGVIDFIDKKIKDVISELVSIGKSFLWGMSKGLGMEKEFLDKSINKTIHLITEKGTDAIKDVVKATVTDKVIKETRDELTKKLQKELVSNKLSVEVTSSMTENQILALKKEKLKAYIRSELSDEQVKSSLQDKTEVEIQKKLADSLSKKLDSDTIEMYKESVDGILTYGSSSTVYEATIPDGLKSSIEDGLEEKVDDVFTDAEIDRLADEMLESADKYVVEGASKIDSFVNEIIDVSGNINQTKLDEVITLAKSGDLSVSEVDDLLLKLEKKGNVAFNDEVDELYDIILGPRYSPDSYYSYTELKSMIKDAGLSGRGKGLEAHHLLEKQYADVFNLNKNEIISVPLTPGWHRNVNGVGINIDNAISTKIQSIMTDLGTSTKTPEIIWKAHREVYEKMGQADWASAIYKAYIKPIGIPYK